MADEILQGPLQIATGMIRFTDSGDLFIGMVSDGTSGQAVVTNGSKTLGFGTFAPSLSDPGYDGIRGWDDTDNAESFFHIGSGLTYTHATHTLSASGGGTGDFVGPSSSTDNAIVRFDGTTGKLGQNSAVTIADTTGAMSASGAVSGGNMLSFTNTSTGASSTGGYFAASGATGATFGLVGYGGSSDNASYGGYFSRGSSLNAGLCSQGIDLQEMTAPDAPPTGFGRVYFDSTDSRLRYKTDGGVVHGPLIGGALTSGRVPYATTNGLLTDSANLTYNGTNLIQTGSYAGAIAQVTNTSTAGVPAFEADATGATGLNQGVVAIVSSTGDGSAGIDGRAVGASGKGYGVKGSVTSANNAAYSIYANEHIYLGTYADIAEGSAPATPPSGSGRLYFASSDSRLHYVTDGGVDHGPLIGGALTSGRVPYGTTNGLLTDSSQFLYDGTTLTNIATKAGNGVVANFENDDTSSASKAVSAISLSTSGGSGILARATGASGANYGGYFSVTSADNAGYSIYALEHSYLGTYWDVAEASAPSTPASGSGRFYWTSTGAFHSIDDSGTDRSYVDSAQLPKQNAIMHPIGLNIGVAATTLAETSGTSYLVYVGKASAAFTSCGIDMRVVNAATLVTKGVVGVLTGAPPTAINSTATLTSVGSANYANTNNTTQTVTVTTSGIVTGQDIWLGFYFSGTVGIGTILGMLADPLQSGSFQTYTGDFTGMSGTSTTACGGNTATPPAMRLHVTW